MKTKMLYSVSPLTMSLYRTYRPQSFADVVGQDAIVTTLEQAAAQDKLAHAYLFAGSRGTGKTSVARILAKVLMTQGIEDEVLQKQIIKGVEEGTLVDLLEIDAASNRRIDDVRELLEKIQFSPVVGSAKVYIIDEVHMLTKEAFNALLKTLEEPPAYAYFILATTELNKIPATIQSRCQCFPFRRIREEDIIRRLQFIADQERMTVDRDALRAIANHVQGGMRDAISLLDQVRSLEKITERDIEQRIGSTGLEHVHAVFEALANRNSEEVLDRVRKIEEAGVPIDSFIRQLLSVVRTNLHTAIEEQKPTDELVQILDVLLDAIRDVRSSPLPVLALEAALLSFCQPKKTVTEKSEESVFAKLKKSTPEISEEAVVKEPVIEASTKEPVPETTEEKTSDSEPAGTPVESDLADAIVEAPECSLESIRDAWSTILKETNPASVRMSLKTGYVQNIEGNKVIVSFSSSFHKDKVANAEASRAVEEVMNKIFKKTLLLECTVDEGGAKPVKETETVNLAEAAAEVF